VSVRQLEQLVTDKCNCILYILCHAVVLGVPLVEVEVAFSDRYHLTKSKIVFVNGLWWIQLIPKSNVAEVQVKISTQGYNRHEELPRFSLKESEEQLRPHGEGIN
jgi:hypothetical protein